jgi:hypothetical protein
VPEPTLILLGCSPLVARPKPGDRPGVCPTCKSSIGKFDFVPMPEDLDQGDQFHLRRLLDGKTYCARCDALAEWVERLLAKQRATDRQTAERSSSRLSARRAEQAFRTELAKQVKGRPILSERTRRRIWNGNVGSLDRQTPMPSNLAKEGREFLMSIGQEPDWSLLLDRRGKVIGRTVSRPDGKVIAEMNGEDE